MTGTAVLPKPASGDAPPSRPRARAVLLVVGSVLAVALVALGASQALNWTTGQEHRDQRLTLPGSISRLEVSTTSGNLRLTGTSAPRASVDAQLAGTLHPPRLRLTITSTTARLSADCGFTFLLNCEASMRLSVPAGMTVVARSSSGDISADGLTGSFDLGTSSGNVRSAGGTGTARLATSSGDVTATMLGATTVTASSDSGNVRVSLVVPPDRLSARTSSGDVRVTLPRGPRAYAVSVRTSSGGDSIGVATDPSSPYRITARSSSGNVAVDYAAAP